jgi:Putative Ig domain/Kelch motif
MMIPMRIFRFGLAVLLLMGCILNDRTESNRGSVVDNEVRVGRIFHADGEPAVNARVRIYPVDHVPDTAGLKKVARGEGLVFSVVTDNEGKFKIDALPRGEYNILGDRDGMLSFQDSLFLNDSTQYIPPDTLDAPGSLTGTVVLQPNHDPITVTVHILGTNHHANVTSDGRFEFGQLAAGSYRLLLRTTLPEYTSLYVSTKVRSGIQETIADALTLPYTGIPVVTGLQAEYDTTLSRVRLTWNGVKYRNFSEFAIFRDSVGAKILSTEPIDKITDTVFLDEIFKVPENIEDLSSSQFKIDLMDKKLEYRVKVVNQSDHIGLNYGKVMVQAVSPYRLSLATIPTVQGVSASYDTLRGVVRLNWLKPNYDGFYKYHIVRKSKPIASEKVFSIDEINQSSLVDTVFRRFGPDDTTDYAYTYQIRIMNRLALFSPKPEELTVGAVSRKWVHTQVKLSVLKNCPEVGDDSITVVAYLENPTRGIKRVDWYLNDLTQAPIRRELAGSKVAADTLKISWGQQSSYTLLLRTRDDAGEDWAGQIKVNRNHDPVIVAQADTILLTGSAFSILPKVSDPDGNTLAFKVDSLPSWANFDTRTGRIYGTPKLEDAGREIPINISVLDSCRPVTLPTFRLKILRNSWRAMKPSDTSLAYSVAVAAEGKIFVFMAVGFEQYRFYRIYDPKADSWSQNFDLPDPEWKYVAAVAQGGKIYVAGARENIDLRIQKVSLHALDATTRLWEPLASPTLWRTGYATSLVGGRIYLWGTQNILVGYPPDNTQSPVEIFDPVLGQWTRGMNRAGPRFAYPFTTTVDDKVLATNGSTITRVNIWNPLDNSYREYEDNRLNPTYLCQVNGRPVGFEMKVPFGHVGGNPAGVFDMVSLRWTRISTAEKFRTSFGCAELDGKLYLFGGGEGSVVKSIDEYDPAFDPRWLP